MSIPDSLMEKYYLLLTDLEFDAMMAPRAAKEHLAHEIVRMYHGMDAARAAQEEFKNIFSKGETPENVPEHAAGALAEVLVDSKLVFSKSEVSRLIKQRGVTINGKTAEGGLVAVSAGDVIKIGARRFLRIV